MLIYVEITIGTFYLITYGIGLNEFCQPISRINELQHGVKVIVVFVFVVADVIIVNNVLHLGLIEAKLGRNNT